MNAGGQGGVVVSMRTVEKKYRGEWAVRIAELDLHAGERLLVTGSNGSGKSTLLRILIGATRPDRGTVTVTGALSKGTIGYAPQTGGLAFEQTIGTNLAVRRFVYGLSTAPADEAWYVRRLGLTHHLDRQFGELSGGIQKLASVAAALHVQPSALFLDEPFSGLDPSRRGLLAQILGELGTRLQLMVIASPTAGEESYGLDFDRVIDLVQGRVA